MEEATRMTAASQSPSSLSPPTPAVVPLIVRGDRAWRGVGELTEIRNPWDDSPVARVPRASADDLTAALDWAADRVAGVAAWPVADRIDAMAAWAGKLAQNRDAIARLETREMGKPVTQTRKIVDMVVARIEALCEARRTLCGEVYAADANRRTAAAAAFSLRDPFGVTAGILPFNSPVSALVWKVAPALLMGNAVVIKVSELAPVAALRAAQLLAELSLPEGALQVVHGAGGELGPVIASHPAVRKISVTGSTATGTDVMRRASATFARVTAECGSNDPAVVLRDADLALAAKTVANLGFRTYSGQICTAPKRCIVAREVYEGFAKMLAAEAARVVAGDPMEEATELGPLVNAEAAVRVERQVREAVAAGAQVLLGGPRSGAFVPPIVLGEVARGNPIFREGAFGPVVCLSRANDEDEAVELANDSPYALRASVFARDVHRATTVARRLDCSGVAVNGPSLVDNPKLNVEPRKMSGIGAEGVHASLMEYSQPKFIWINEWWAEG